jgi:hypothetical protein
VNILSELATCEDSEGQSWHNGNTMVVLECDIVLIQWFSLR